MENKPKKLSEFSADERLDLLLKLYEVMKSHNVEKRLNAPKLLDQLVTNLTSRSYERHLHMVIEGTLKATESELAQNVAKDINEVLKGVSGEDKQVEIAAKIGVGDMVKPIENASVVFGEGKKTIEHKEGEVILYDLWATWCPPCQGPMAHNQEMLTKNKEKWGDKVRIIGLSIDDSTDAIKSHVEAKGWTAVEHYHVDNGTCTASATYGSGGVPHVFLVDKSGKIVFMGHPSERELEQDIDKLLAGEVLTGEGTGPSAEAEEAESGEAQDAAKITEAVAKFEADAKAFIEREDVKNVKELMRGFCVVVDSVEAKNGKIVHKPVCHTQLIGKQEGIDSMFKLCKEINQGPWENKTMERVV